MEGEEAEYTAGTADNDGTGGGGGGGKPTSSEWMMTPTNRWFGPG